MSKKRKEDYSKQHSLPQNSQKWVMGVNITKTQTGKRWLGCSFSFPLSLHFFHHEGRLMCKVWGPSLAQCQQLWRGCLLNASGARASSPGRVNKEGFYCHVSTSSGAPRYSRRSLVFLLCLGLSLRRILVFFSCFHVFSDCLCFMSVLAVWVGVCSWSGSSVCLCLFTCLCPCYCIFFCLSVCFMYLSVWMAVYLLSVYWSQSSVLSVFLLVHCFC